MGMHIVGAAKYDRYYGHPLKLDDDFPVEKATLTAAAVGAVVGILFWLYIITGGGPSVDVIAISGEDPETDDDAPELADQNEGSRERES